MATATVTEPQITFETLLGRLEEITPIIEKHRDEAEESLRLSEPVVTAMKEAGLFRLYLPRSLGGLEVDPVTHFRISERVARIDCAASWVMGIANSFAFVASYLQDEGTAMMFGSDPNALACGTLNSIGKASPVDGGYRFSSRAPFNSGSRFSDWCLMQGEVQRDAPKEDAEPHLIGLFCPLKDAEIIDNWDVSGLRGTASNDIQVNDLLIPSALTFSLETLGQPSTNPHYGGALYRMPVCNLPPSTGVPPGLGALREALDWVSDLAQNKTPFASSSKLRERSIAQINYGKALGLYRASYALTETTIERVWSKVVSGEAASAEDKADFFLPAAQASNMIAEGVKLTASVAGSTWIRKGNPVERAVRDVEVLRNHAYLCESRFGTATQVYWGLDPDFAFITI
jgi:alkylation response protein AidB-like acyl-CoA dehydrogenase